MEATRLIARAAITIAIALGGGCTFGGLANYAIDPCDPADTQAKDVCDGLNKDDPTSCTPFQCDTASHRCVRKARDDDHDNDSPVACGGADCDDHNGKRSGRAPEVCDGVDNNCNGFVDENALTAGEERIIASPGALAIDADPLISTSNASSMLASFVASACIPLVDLGHNETSTHGPGCALLSAAQGLEPRQPYAHPVMGSIGAAFIATSDCATGRLGYVTAANTAPALLDCTPATGAALPAFDSMPATLGTNAKSGVIVWYEDSAAARSDAATDCATVKPVPLRVFFASDLTTTPALAPAAVHETTETSVGTRPVALLAIEKAGGIVMAAPLGNDVGAWLFTPTTLTAGALPVPQHVPALAGAHATALASYVDDAIHVALVAEIGCASAGSLRLVLGTIGAGTAPITFAAPIDVIGRLDVATQPSVAWISTRSEWWVSWIDAQPHQRVQRFRADGTPVGGSIDAGKPFRVGAVSASESVFGFDPTAANGGSFVEIPLGCH